MRSALLCASIAERLFKISRLSHSAECSKRIFTGGGVTENSICSAAFCESAALRELPQSSRAARCQIPLFVTFGDIFPRSGESRPLGWGLWYGGKVSG